MFSVTKMLGFENKKFKKYENALEFWNNNKDYNMLAILETDFRLLHGKKHKVYRRRYIKWRR